MESQEVVHQSKSLKQLMRDYPLISYFLLAYGFSWLISLPYLLSLWGVIKGNFITLFALKQWVGPALAAIIMVRVTEGKEGLVNLRQRVKQWRAGWQWYLFALVAIPVLVLIGVIFQPGALDRFEGFPPLIFVTYFFTFIAVFIGVGLPEEVGWRGFALPRMQKRFGPFKGTLILGVLWAFWHLLFFLAPDHGGGPGSPLAPVLINFAIFSLMVVVLTFIFTWVFNHTGGSILIASLLHASIDTPQLSLLPFFIDVGQANSIAGEKSLDLAGLIVFGVVALLVVIITRGRLGYTTNANGN
jgi:membrane protease YdiL (CAAX protease family)